MSEILKTYFQQNGFSGDNLQIVLSAFDLRQFKKGEFLVEDGKIARHIAFIKTGIFQYFSFVNGEERTTYVSVPATFAASLLSFIRQIPALESIRAVTAGSAWVIGREDLQHLVTAVAGFKDYYIKLLEGALCGIDETRHDLIVLTAEQRYEKLLRQEPQLLQQIPLQYLSSMLGVTPRHLSRIRKNIR